MLNTFTASSVAPAGRLNWAHPYAVGLKRLWVPIPPAESGGFLEDLVTGDVLGEEHKTAPSGEVQVVLTPAGFGVRCVSSALLTTANLPFQPVATGIKHYTMAVETYVPPDYAGGATDRTIYMVGDVAASKSYLQFVRQSTVGSNGNSRFAFSDGASFSPGGFIGEYLASGKKSVIAHIKASGTSYLAGRYETDILASTFLTFSAPGTYAGEPQQEVIGATFNGSIGTDYCDIIVLGIWVWDRAFSDEELMGWLQRDDGVLLSDDEDPRWAPVNEIGSEGELAVTLAGDAIEAIGSVAVSGELAVTLADDGAFLTGQVGAGVVGNTGEGVVTLAGDTLDGAATLAVVGEVTATLAGDALLGAGIAGANGPFAQRPLLVVN
jgi:hypothetical protein